MTLEIFISVTGDDQNAGTREAPFATLQRAQQAARASGAPVTITIREGTYYLDETLSFSPEDSGIAGGRVTYRAFPGEFVTLSGGKQLQCDWLPYKNGIMMCQLPQVASGQLTFDQLFVNGKRQIRARYPNFDGSDPKNITGYLQAAGKIDDEAPDPFPEPDDDMTFSGDPQRGISFNPATFTQKRWARPTEAVIHIYQAHYWGNLQWQMKGIDWENHRIWFGKGGQQMGAKWSHAPNVVNQHSRFFIENVFEELDSPGEWYLDREAGLLYYIPAEGVDFLQARVEVPVLQQIVRFTGSQEHPVSHLTLDGFRFTHTASTFLDTYSIPSLSDWSIHRGGTVFMEGARDCHITNCFFDAVGGNAVFLNLFNRGNTVTGCKFIKTGDSAICFVGSQ